MRTVRSISWTVGGGRRPPASPDGRPLVIEVSCPSGVNGRHEVLVGEDWSVQAPHDLLAEQVLAAFGGDSPCMRLVETVKAARVWLELELRHAIPRLNRKGEHAVPAPKGQCCADASPLPKAASHAQSVDHLANVCGVRVTQLAEVVDGLATAYGIRHGNGPHPDEMRAAQHCVNPPLAVNQLWDLGLSPRAIQAIYTAVNGRVWAALPRSLYEAVVLQRPDLRWLERTLQAPEVAPQTADETAALAQWLTQTPTALDRKDPEARAKWLATGLPWHWILTLSESGYKADDLTALQGGTPLSAIGAAQTLVRWAAAGCHPRPEELLRLRELGVGYRDENISAAVISRLRDLLATDGITLPETTLGFLFVAAGSAVMAHAWVRAGVADPYRIAELIVDGETPTSLM